MKNYFALFIGLLLMLIMSPVILMAQTEVPQFNPETVDKILFAGIGGIGVAALTELLKRLFKASGVGAYLISLLVSFAATALFLATGGLFSVVSLIIYGIAVFLTANGIYKFSAKAARNE